MAQEEVEEGRFLSLLEKLFKDIDQESIQAEVRGLLEEKASWSKKKIAEHMTKRAAVRAASIGAAAGIPGGALGVLAMAPDIFALVLLQSRLVLSIAFLHGEKANVQQRFKEVLATLAVATGSSAGRQGARLLIAKGLEKAAAAKIAKKIFGRFFVKKIPTIAPILGTVAGGAINYMSVRAVGKAAFALYSGHELPAAIEPPALPPAAEEPPPTPKRRVRKPAKAASSGKRRTPAKKRAPRKRKAPEV